MINQPPKRNMPHHTEAEQAVLGGMLKSKEALENLKDVLAPEDFYHLQHRTIFESMQGLLERQLAVDLTTLTAHLHDFGRLEEIGGAVYLLHVFESVTTIEHLDHYVSLVQEKSLTRKIIERAHHLVEQGYNPELSAEGLLDEARKQFSSLEAYTKEGDFERIENVLDEYIKNLEALASRKGDITGLQTGFKKLDEMTSGLQKNDLIIVAARPAMGKTAFALNIAQNVATLNEEAKVAIFSLEMGASQLVGRMISSEGLIEGRNLRSGNLSEKEWGLIRGAKSRLAQAEIFIDDTPGIKIGQLRAKSRALANTHGLDLIIVDYLQLMQGSNFGGNRQLEISEISRTLKEIARELEVPVIALSQLSRQVEAREDKRPLMSDLRESGSIEQDADIVIFLRREDYYREKEEGYTPNNQVDVIFGKHRNGSTGEIKLGFRGEFAKFENVNYVPSDQIPPE